MTEWLTVGTNEKRIHAILWSGKSYPDGDYESSLKVLFNKREIAYMTEDNDELIIYGDFKEADYDKHGPKGPDMFLGLNTRDLLDLQWIVQDFNDGSAGDSSPRWKRSIGGRG